MEKIIKREIINHVEVKLKDLDTLLYIYGNMTAVLARVILLATFFCDLTELEEVSEYIYSAYFLGVIILIVAEYMKREADRVNIIRQELKSGVVEIWKIEQIIGWRELEKICQDVERKYANLEIKID